jgi:hypothetical protein
MTETPENQSDGSLSEEQVSDSATAVAEQPPVDQQAEETTTEAAPDEGSPESYEPFSVPEGADSLEEEQTAILIDAFKEANLTQEQAQAFIDKTVPEAQRRDAERKSKQAEAWREQTQKDEQLGGDDFEKNIATAHKGFERFASEGLKELIETTGLGNHPEFIRAWKQVGDAISEDQFVDGRQPQGPNAIVSGDAMLAKDVAAQAFYGDRHK